MEVLKEQIHLEDIMVVVMAIVHNQHVREEVDLGIF
jgi:hypothetical protein